MPLPAETLFASVLLSRGRWALSISSGPYFFSQIALAPSEDTPLLKAQLPPSGRHCLWQAAHRKMYWGRCRWSQSWHLHGAGPGFSSFLWPGDGPHTRHCRHRGASHNSSSDKNLDHSRWAVAPPTLEESPRSWWNFPIVPQAGLPLAQGLTCGSE